MNIHVDLGRVVACAALVLNGVLGSAIAFALTVTTTVHRRARVRPAKSKQGMIANSKIDERSGPTVARCREQSRWAACVAHSLSALGIVSMAASCSFAHAQEGVSKVTLAVEPALYYVSRNYPFPPALTCPTAMECLEAEIAAARARNPTTNGSPITLSLVNVRPAPGVGTVNGVIRGFIADWRSDWVDGSGTAQSSVSPSVGATGLDQTCPQDGMNWQLVTVSPQPDVVYRCERVVTSPQQPCDACPKAEVGNPIALATGAKVQRTEDYKDATGWLAVSRFQTSGADSLNGSLSFGHVASLIDRRDATPTKGCYPSYYIDLDIDPSTGAGINRYIPYCYEFVVVPSFVGVYVYIDNSQRLVFGGSGNSPTSLDQLGQLEIVGSGATRSYLLKRKHFPGLEVFDSSGQLTLRVHPSGRKLSYGYVGIQLANGGQRRVLSTITDDFGRQLTFGYGPTNELATITDPTGQDIRYIYGEASSTCRVPGFCRQLTSVIYQDQSRRRYHYDEPQLMLGDTNSYGRLTGITDENGRRHASFSFNSWGRAVATEHAGGVGRHLVAYTTDAANRISRVDVTGPLGELRTTHFATPAMTSFVSSRSQPAGSGTVASSDQWVYDASGTLARHDDFSRGRTCFGNDTARNVQISRVDGLSTSTDCVSVAQPGATLPLGGRKTSIQWHPDWRLPTKVAEPGRITTTVYNGLPDPFNGGATASCAPSTALLPDGKPIAVLCKQVEQATTDANGASGFSAALQAGVANRITTWTYNQWGQVLSENGPRTDVNDITTYTYYSDTTADHLPGDLQSVTNAAGRVTQYSKYNRHGHLLESTDPNGVVSVNTYDLRQRLLSTTVGGQSTTYTYDPVGQLKRVTLPDTSWVGYDYDDAHRQVAVYDSVGNRTEYLLDNAGNRIGENTRDPGGALKRQLSRSIDALGRVQQTTGRE